MRRTLLALVLALSSVGAQAPKTLWIFPGEVNTPLLDKRPTPVSAEARQQMLQPEDVAECVALAALLPPRAIVEHLVVRPRVQEWVSRRS